MFFRNAYWFLSNFAPAPIKDDQGRVWPTAEHAYQAMKFSDPAMWDKIAKLPGKGLKGFIYRHKGDWRTDFHEIKRDLMKRIVRRKFVQNPEMADKLKRLEGVHIVEDNSWHDNYWGNCLCDWKLPCAKQGRNEMGKILMEIREELISPSS